MADLPLVTTTDDSETSSFSWESERPMTHQLPCFLGIGRSGMADTGGALTYFPPPPIKHKVRSVASQMRVEERGIEETTPTL